MLRLRSRGLSRSVGKAPLPDWVSSGNLFTNPQDISSATGGWTNTNCTVTANDISGPYAGAFGDLVTESTDGAGATHEIQRSVTIANSTAYLHRLIVQRINRNVRLFYPAAQFGGTAQTVDFDLSAGTSNTVSGSPVSTITPLGSDWWLVTIQATSGPAAAGAFTHRALRLLDGATLSYTGTGSAAVYVAAVGLHAV